MRLRLFVVIIVLGSVMPAFAIDMTLRNVDGREQNLNDFKGNWLVVNFWATWCPPCIAEMPDLQSFHDRHRGKGAMVLGLNTENFSGNQLQSFLDTYAITYPVYHGAELMDSELGSVTGLPTTFLISPQGEVEARQVGSVTGSMIEKFIENWEAEHSSQ